MSNHLFREFCYSSVIEIVTTPATPEAGGHRTHRRLLNDHRTPGEQGKLFPNFSACVAGTNSFGPGFANVAKRTNPAVNGSRNVPDLADFISGDAALRISRH